MKVYLGHASDVKDRAEKLKNFFAENKIKFCEEPKADKAAPYIIRRNMKNCDALVLLFSEQTDESHKQALAISAAINQGKKIKENFSKNFLIQTNMNALTGL